MFQKSLMWLFAATMLSSPVAWAENPRLLAEAASDPVPVAPVTATTTAAVAEAAPSPDAALSLNDAIQRALAESPRLKAYESALMASKGERRQAGALPNPEIGVEAENVAGQGRYRGTDSAEFTYGVTQLIEVGGKRSARQEAAGKGYEIAGMQYKAARFDLIRDVTAAYAGAVAAQEEVKLAEEQKQLAGEVLESVSKRVAAAAEPLIQKSKAQVALATSEIAYGKAMRGLVTARNRLASLWGGNGGDFTLDSSDFFTLKPPPALPETVSRLAATPDIARLDAEIGRARANLELERANAIPDPRVNVGVREFRESNDQAFVVGVSLPIPVWNLNRGNIARARHEVSRSESVKQATVLGLSNELSRATQELHTAYAEAEALKATILPAAKTAFSLSRQGYQAGRFPYLEVLDAQRTLFEARSQYIAALNTYHARRAEVERLTAAHSARIQPDEEHHD